jgi:hypothetical protein
MQYVPLSENSKFKANKRFLYRASHTKQTGHMKPVRSQWKEIKTQQGETLVRGATANAVKWDHG